MYINSYCGNNYHMVSWQYEQLLQMRDTSSSSSSSTVMKSGSAGLDSHGITSDRSESDNNNNYQANINNNYRSSDCAVSTLLVFQQPKSEIIMCVLLKYDDAEFLACIEDDSKFSGATCIREAFDECFDRLKVINGLNTDGDDTDTSSSSNSGSSRSRHNSKSSVKASSLASTSAYSQRNNNFCILETFNNNAFRATNTWVSASNWSIHSGKRALWLGSLAWTGNWQYYYKGPTTTSPSATTTATTTTSYTGSDGTLFAAAVKTIKLRQANEVVMQSTNSGSTSTTTTSTTCRVSFPCHHYSLNLSVLTYTDESYKQRYQHYSYDLALASSLQHNARRDKKTRVTYGIGIERISCSPSVLIAGFSRSATTFLYTILTHHPSILPTLRGAQHKEPHCYLYDPSRSSSIIDRIWCYPFLEPGDPFISIDGSAVQYNLDPSVPLTFKEVRYCIILFCSGMTT